MVNSHKLDIFSPKRPIFLHACATDYDIPSHISTMAWTMMGIRNHCYLWSITNKLTVNGLERSLAAMLLNKLAIGAGVFFLGGGGIFFSQFFLWKTIFKCFTTIFFLWLIFFLVIPIFIIYTLLTIDLCSKPTIRIMCKKKWKKNY